MCHGKIYTGKYGVDYKHLIVQYVIYNLLVLIWDIVVITHKTPSFNILQMLACNIRLNNKTYF